MIGWVRWLNERYVLEPQKKQIHALSNLKDRREKVNAYAIYDVVAVNYLVMLFCGFTLTLSPINAVVANAYCDEFMAISGGLPLIFMAEGAAYFVAAAAITIKSASRYSRIVGDKAPVYGFISCGRYMIAVIVAEIVGVFGFYDMLKTVFNEVSCSGGGNVIDFIFYVSAPFIFQLPFFVGLSMAVSLYLVRSKRG